MHLLSPTYRGRLNVNDESSFICMSRRRFSVRLYMLCVYFGVQAMRLYHPSVCVTKEGLSAREREKEKKKTNDTRRLLLLPSFFFLSYSLFFYNIRSSDQLYHLCLSLQIDDSRTFKSSTLQTNN